MFKGIKLKLHPAAILAIGFLAAFDMDGRYTLLLLAALIHEGGHALAMAASGKLIDRITLLPVGFDISYHGGVDSYAADIAIALCGPLVNLAAAFLFSSCDGPMYDYFVGVNLTLCFFNLLTIYPLDGSRVLELTLEYFTGPDRAWSIFMWESLVASLGCFALSVKTASMGRGAWSMFVFGYLLVCQRKIATLNVKKCNRKSV